RLAPLRGGAPPATAHLARRRRAASRPRGTPGIARAPRDAVATARATRHRARVFRVPRVFPHQTLGPRRGAARVAAGRARRALRGDQLRAPEIGRASCRGGGGGGGWG